MPPRIPDTKREAIATDIHAKLPRNEIARKHGVSGSTVSGIAREIGSTEAFDRSQTENATRAVQVDNAARRAELSRRFLEEAHAALDDLHAKTLVFAFGGRDNEYNERTLDKPPTADKRNLMIIAATAADKHMAIDKHDAASGSETVGSLLGSMMDDLIARHGDSPTG